MKPPAARDSGTEKDSSAELWEHSTRTEAAATGRVRSSGESGSARHLHENLGETLARWGCGKLRKEHAKRTRTRGRRIVMMEVQ